MPSVADVLDHLGGGDGGFKETAGCPCVDLTEDGAVRRMRCTDHGHCRAQEVGHGRPLAHELGVDTHTEVPAHPLGAGLLQRGNDDRLGGPRQHRAAEYDEMKRVLSSERLTYLPAHGFDMSEIEPPAA